MLVTPLAVIFVLVAGAAGAPGEPASVKLRGPARAITPPPARFELAPRRTIPPLLRAERADRLVASTYGARAVAPSSRYSVAGVAMGLGDAAVDNDRFDLRMLRIEPGRMSRMRGPLDAGLRLRLTGGRRAMQADLGLTGGVAGVIGNALRD